jgi:hypothetical protein
MVASFLRGLCLETGVGQLIDWKGVGSLGLWPAHFVTGTGDYSTPYLLVGCVVAREV